MREHRNQIGRHRLGTAGGIHCVDFPEVALAVADHRRSWLMAFIGQGRHTFASMRRRAEAHSSPNYWIPATAS
ncbi:hypothetical protein [Rhodococcus marinonascens]|uniref:hypothetical protein n=1 Tax=Rhodococcus marinonascens TaxID=38311 RepID=UPI00093319D5|nr:hypothetical protein [Rhodococcus marinonascens]